MASKSRNTCHARLPNATFPSAEQTSRPSMRCSRGTDVRSAADGIVGVIFPLRTAPFTEWRQVGFLKFQAADRHFGAMVCSSVYASILGEDAYACLISSTIVSNRSKYCCSSSLFLSANAWYVSGSDSSSAIWRAFE